MGAALESASADGVFAAGQLDGLTDWVLGLSPGCLLRAERVLTRMAESVGERRIEKPSHGTHDMAGLVPISLARP